MKNWIIIFIIIIITLFYFLFFNKKILENFDSITLEKNIFLLWLQGWNNASWLNKQVAESWEINNPGWKIHYVDIENLKDYVSDIEYVYNKDISPQAKSDIIRLNLLKIYGGIWADATMLCMQPLEHWVNDAVEPSGLWMYHGKGAGMNIELGPASWFIVSKKNSYLITKWKEECDRYWNSDKQEYGYFWMDELFKNLYYNDKEYTSIRQWQLENPKFFIRNSFRHIGKCKGDDHLTLEAHSILADSILKQM
jgi:hypothetical protein